MKAKGIGGKYHILVAVRWPVGGIRSFINYTYNCFRNVNRYHFTIVCPNYSETGAMLNDLGGLDVSYKALGSDFSTARFLREVVRTVRSNHVDLIHSHGLTAGIHCSVIARIFRIPHIVTLHELLYREQFRVGLKGAIKRKVLSSLISIPDVIQLVSHDAQANILEYFPQLRFGRTKLRPILNGIDVSRYLNSKARDLRHELNLAENFFLIGFLGRFMPIKGFRYLINALEYILMNGIDLEKKPVLLTFGWGAFIREEMEIAKQKGVGESIISLPFVPNVAETIKGLDVIVMPSLAEACGVLAMEAMVCGVPVIGTSCLGLREVLRDTPNVMVPAGDGQALAKALINEIRHPSRSRAAAFKEKAACRFDVRKASSKVEKLMLELISGARNVQ